MSTLIGVATVACSLLLVGSASARVEGSSDYTKAQTFSGALRYIRLELGYEVIERDADAAYLIFRYAPPGQPKQASNGTVEIVESDGRVRLFVQLPRLPEYHERMLRDGLLRKLREEYGAPPRKKPPEKKPDPESPGRSKGRDGSSENSATFRW